MQIGLWKKGLVLGIILLFIAVELSPIILADDKNFKADDEPIDNYDNYRTSDDYKEIITLIIGNRAWFDWIKRRGIFRGEVELGPVDWSHGGGIDLIGLGRYNGGLKIFTESVHSVHAYRFIGFREFSDGPNTFFGFALGNIEWT